MKHERKMAVTVRRRGESEPLFVGGSDKPTAAAPMATPCPGIHQAPAVIVLRPAWLDTPLWRMIPRLLTLMLIFAPGIAFWALITRLVWRAF